MRDKYILDAAGLPVPVDDVFEWGKWYSENPKARVVKQERVGSIWVSTVFLGLDHSFGMGGAPVLWETMVFDGPEHSERYCSREAALKGHARAVALVRQRLAVAGRPAAR